MSHIQTLIIFLILGLLLTRCQPTQKKNKAQKDKPKTAHTVSVKDYGAIGDGIADDTKSIQEAINATSSTNDTLLIPSGIYKIKTLVLRSNTKLKSVGLIRQHLPADTQFYGRYRQNSSSPLFFGRNLENIWLSFHAETRNEAVYIYNSKGITITNSTLAGNPKKLHAFPGLIFYNCQDISISQSVIHSYGSPRLSARTYQSGTAIRFLTCQKINIQRNHLHHNGENGIFMHASGYVHIERNRIEHNGMSGIQIGFGKSKAEQNYVIRYNLIRNNAADAIDINNKITPQPLAINCLIEHNRSAQNGFVRDTSTVDGSGIATLVNVSKVRLYHNSSFHSNRPAIYLERCGLISSEHNETDAKIEIVGGFEQLEFAHNKFDALTLLTHTKGRKLRLDDNEMRTVLLPNQIAIDSLILYRNLLRNANLNLNFGGYFAFSNNTIQSKDQNGALLLIHLKKAEIKKNHILNTASYGMIIRKNAQQVQIVANEIKALNACIYDEGSENLSITENTLIALPGGSVQRTVVSKNPNALKLSKNEHQGGKSDNSIKFEGEGTAFIGDEDIISGYPDYGKIIVKPL